VLAGIYNNIDINTCRDPVKEDFMAKTLVYVRMLTMAMFMFGAGAGLSACNTMDGAGEDIEEAGEKIQDSAR
jgi:predicted small secreted protein